MPTEKYYFNNEKLLNTKSNINYVQLNNDKSFNSYSYLEQSSDYDINTNNKVGKWYASKFAQENFSDNTINISGKSTLSLEHGILVYYTDRNTLLPPINSAQYYVPAFTSGIYLDKDVKIIREIVDVDENILTIFTSTY